MTECLGICLYFVVLCLTVFSPFSSFFNFAWRVAIINSSLAIFPSSGFAGSERNIGINLILELKSPTQGKKSGWLGRGSTIVVQNYSTTVWNVQQSVSYKKLEKKIVFRNNWISLSILTYLTNKGGTSRKKKVENVDVFFSFFLFNSLPCLLFYYPTPFLPFLFTLLLFCPSPLSIICIPFAFSLCFSF